MSLTAKKNTPLGIFALSALFLLSTIGIIYMTMIMPSYLVIGIISIVLFSYAGIGLIRLWTGVRQIIIAITILLFVGGAVEMVGALFLDGTEQLSTTSNILWIGVRLILFPLVWSYFKTEKIKMYFQSKS